MIVADTSALVAIASIDFLDRFLSEFDVHTTELVVDELTETSDYDDRHGDAAEAVLENLERIDTHEVPEAFTSSRVDRGEGSCAILTNDLAADFLITDDFRALPEVQTITDAQVAISPILLRALVRRDALDRAAALELLDQLADQRDWLGVPIHRRARELFDPD